MLIAGFAGGAIDPSIVPNGSRSAISHVVVSVAQSSSGRYAPAGFTHRSKSRTNQPPTATSRASIPASRTAMASGTEMTAAAVFVADITTVAGNGAPGPVDVCDVP